MSHDIDMIASKLPSGTSLKLNKVPNLSEESNKSSLSRPMHLSGSPPLKRQRTSSSNSPDMRRKLLGKTLEQKIEKRMESEKNDSKVGSEDVFSVSLDEIDEMDPEVDETKSRCYEARDPSDEVENKSPTFSPTSATPKSTNSPKLQTEEIPTKTVDWLQVSRTRRKSRFYKIEATDEEEGFKAIHKASDHTKIPAGLNGRKPFMIVPGIEYGLEEDCADADGVADEKEIKMIKNEKYFLDSFVCDTGYLSDDELNETPSQSKFESKVRRIRRANNIKEKRKKMELLGEPEVCGPFWWNGKGGCKKEVKKWQTMVLSSLPIPTTLSSPPPSVPVEEDLATDQDGKVVAEVSVAPADKEAPATAEEEVKEVEEVEEVEEYETKYHIKYAVKFLVQRRLREGRGVASPQSPQGPQVCSTPMVRRPASAQAQVSAVSRVS